MSDLDSLIQREGRKNNELKRLLDEQDYVPSPDIVKELGLEHAFTISRESVEFRTRIQLEILMSNYHIIGLMRHYLAQTPSATGKIPELLSAYEAETQSLKSDLIAQFMGGYDARW